jgi:hypothetical protein
MSLSQEEMKDYLHVKAEESRQRRATQLRGKIGVAEKISQLTADPRWEVYGRYVEQMRDGAKRRADYAHAKLLDPTTFLKPEEYGAIKLVHAMAIGSASALDAVLLIAKKLIEDGEVALKELKEVRELDNIINKVQ